jgi:Protein of unknown function (DUF2442)
MPSTPYVVAAIYLSGHELEVEFSDGVVKGIDFAPWLKGPVFEPLKDIEYFKSFILDGWTVSWPNGADIAPETLYQCAGKRESAA